MLRNILVAVLAGVAVALEAEKKDRTEATDATDPAQLQNSGRGKASSQKQTTGKKNQSQNQNQNQNQTDQQQNQEGQTQGGETQGGQTQEGQTRPTIPPANDTNGTASTTKATKAPSAEARSEVAKTGGSGKGSFSYDPKDVTYGHPEFPDIILPFPPMPTFPPIMDAIGPLQFNSHDFNFYQAPFTMDPLLPRYADPSRYNDAKIPTRPDYLSDYELLPPEQRKATVGAKDPYFYVPEYVELFPGWGVYEPLEPIFKIWMSPVFFVDHAYNGGCAAIDRVYDNHDYGGYNKPHAQSNWPLIDLRVQKHFGVGADCNSCSCKHYFDKEVFYIQPKVWQMDLPWVTEPVWEPLYPDPNYRMPRQNQRYMYAGHDFGGYNIPFPHPRPPTPGPMYADCFVDLHSIHGGERYQDEALYGFTGGYVCEQPILGRLYGPHDLLGSI